MRFVLERVRSGAGAAAAEWWSADPEGAPGAVVSVGTARGRRQRIQLGPAGLVVIHGGRREPRDRGGAAVTGAGHAPPRERRAPGAKRPRSSPCATRRSRGSPRSWPHELKAPLHAALVADDPSGLLEEALRLVDTLLEAAHARPGRGRSQLDRRAARERPANPLPIDVQISPALATSLPLPAVALETILRNLLANAVAAGARHVHVATVRSD